MERIVDYKIGNRTLKLNCSIQATLDIAKVYGSMDEALAKIDELTNSQATIDTAKGVRVAADMISIFAEQGHKYMQLMGEKCDKPYTAEEIMTLTAWDKADLMDIFGAVQAAVTHGTKPTVEAVPPKNAEATPGESND